MWYRRSPVLLSGILAVCLLFWILLGGVAFVHSIWHEVQENSEMQLRTVAALVAKQKEIVPTSGGVSKTIQGYIIFEPQQISEKMWQLLAQPSVFSKKRLSQYGWLDGIDSDLMIMRLDDTSNRLIGLVLPRQKMIQPVFMITLYFAVIVLICIFYFAFFVYRQTKQRLRAIRESVDNILEGNGFQKRLVVTRNYQDEYNLLNLSINNLLDRVTGLMQALCTVNDNIAHDLRTPLNRIRNRMEITLIRKNQTIDDCQQALADSIEDLDELLQIFQSLLLISNLDSKSRNYQFTEIDLSHLLMRLSGFYAVIAEEKSQQFNVSIMQPLYVLGNESLLSQAFANLLDNAIKFTPEGGQISFEVSVYSDFVTVIVSDTGPGISPQYREKVFERFFRVDQTRHISGSGLGMSLVRAIVELHRGSIQLGDNKPGLRAEVRLRVLK